ncbi:MAG TPA: beta-L-arabinofuranosidase domain-containing protein [Verrucomicrobiae bacterium]
MPVPEQRAAASRLFGAIFFLGFVAASVSAEDIDPRLLSSVPIGQVAIEDEFWSPKLKVWREVTIPDCLAKFEKDGALTNFDRIRDSIGGKHAGPPWYDGLVYEMIRGCADFLAARRDAKLERRLDGYIERITAAQAKEPDGYLNTYTQLERPTQRWGLNGGDDNWQHDVYNAGAMVEAAVHYYRATGKTQLLQAATRLANHMADLMGLPPKKNVVPGHSLGEEALVKLYLLFREQPGLKAQMPVPVDEDRYLRLAEFWIENRGNHEGRKSYGSYGQDHQPLLQQQTIEGHAVRATLLCAGLVAAANVNGREDYLAAAVRLWDNMVHRRMYVIGGLGAVAGHEGFGADYELPNNGYLETCAAIGAGFFHHNLNLALADARYADELERVLYNAVLPGVSLKGDTYFYENPLAAGPNRARWAWHGCPCCPPMFLKIMGALPGYLYAQGPGEVYANLFAGSRATLTVKRSEVRLRQTTRYPWEGEVKFAVDPEREVEFGLNVRLPAWCAEPKLTVNGQPPAALEKVRGYARLQRKWRRGDIVELSLPMPARRLKADPRVEADLGRVALQRGPLVYCLEAADNAGHVRNLVIPPEAALTAQRVDGLLGGVTVVKGPALALQAAASPGQLSPSSAGVPGVTSTGFTAIPYFANANRRLGEMEVWVAESAERAEPLPSPATITVRANQTTERVSRYLTGACIEDVNHEIYGGIDSQMIFGESFAEPAKPPPLRGFTAYGGRWVPKESELDAAAGDGPKLLCDAPAFADGEASVEVWFPDQRGGNAGLIVKVSQAGPGADRFTGYEVALETAGRLVLGRHRQNWEPIRNVECEVPVRQWIRLAVRLSGKSLEVLVNGRSITRYEDTEHPLESGVVGLRTWQREARFRNLATVAAGETRKHEFAYGGQGAWGGGVSGMWRALRRGRADGQFGLEEQNAYSGRQSQRLTFTGGEGEIGVENQGLNRWGMNLARGKTYEGFLCVRADRPAEIFVALESRDGANVYAEKRLKVPGGDWRRLDFKLKPDANDQSGRFAVKLKRPGSVTVGYAFLQPGPWGRFKGLPTRKDVAEGLIGQGITVLRQGGCMVNAAEYRWKKMIGPRERRPPYAGWWYPYSSNGWGIFDFLNFCEAAGFLGIPDVNMDETPQDMADFIEYANGPAGSEWGRRRAADGHPAPYRLKYLELGNEERVNEEYWQKFEPLAEAIWAKDPEIILVVGDFAYSHKIEDPFNFTGAAGRITSLAAQQKILQLARRNNREVWFDVHIGTEGPRPDFGGTMSYIDALERIAEGARHRVVIFEFNAGNHSQRRALANAAAIGTVQRDGRIPIATSANCLQPDGQNDNDWNQGLLFLNPSQVWLQPPGFVTRMISRAYQPWLAPVDVEQPKGGLDVAAMRSQDGRTLTLQVVNAGEQEVAAVIRLEGFKPSGPVAAVEELAGPLDARNTAGSPTRIIPRSEQWRLSGTGDPLRRVFPPRSFTVLIVGDDARSR